jgi:predicted nucleic acid-binding protein
MTFADLARGAAVFVDANIFVFHFQPHAVFGSSCTDLLKRMERGELSAYTSTHVLSEVAHRLMTLGASVLFHWPSKVVQRLKQNPTNVQQLSQFRSALRTVSQSGIQVLTIPAAAVDTAAGISQQMGLLSNDALIVAVMQANGLTNLASNDADFDRVPGLTRYAPL